MNWYLSKLVFRIVCGDGQHRAQFDEQLRLIAAADKENMLILTFQLFGIQHMLFEVLATINI